MAKNTQLKGDIAKAQAIAYFTMQGLDVSLPLTESAQYDLIVDTEEGLKKVQVKYSKHKQVRTRRIHSNSTGYIIKYYEKGSYDWIFVYVEGVGNYLVKEHLPHKAEATLKEEWKVN